MSGFAVLIQPNTLSLAREDAFQALVQRVAEFKHLDWPGTQAVGWHCTAAKLDSSASRHRGIIQNEATGSWLLAAGTMVCLSDDRGSDSGLDALLKDYVEWGADALQSYEGHFALMIYNGREKSLSIISDPMGHFAIFYGGRGNQTFIAASALAIARQIGSKPDKLAIECFLRTGLIYGDKTLWQDVKRLPPATILKITPNRVETFEYWALTIDQTIAHLSLDEALDYAVDMMSRIFRRFLQREGQVWADLTGGFDTRTTTMFMAREGIPFTAYCVGPVNHPDVKISRQICQEMEWDYRHMPMPDNWEHEQCDWLKVAVYKGDARLNMLQLAYVLQGQQERAMTHKAHVLGVGVDEWREHVYLRTAVTSIGRSGVNYDDLVGNRMFTPIPFRLFTLSQDRTQDVREELKMYFAKLASRCAGWSNLAKMDLIYLRHRHPTHRGAYMSATAGIMRSLMPFCFKEPETFGLSLNYTWRLNYHYHFVRALLERENPRLARIKTTKGGPTIPMRLTNIYQFWPLYQQIIGRKAKEALCKLFGKPITIWPHAYAEYPLSSWRKGWISYARSNGLLTPSEMRAGALYNADAFQTLVSQAEAKNFQYEELLGRVATVEMALRTVGTSIE